MFNLRENMALARSPMRQASASYEHCNNGNPDHPKNLTMAQDTPLIIFDTIFSEICSLLFE